ncbi:hypothetical protein ABZ565_18325 [Streptomyces sp. NPDC016469]|uniref:hypothetical protein n=1 Tax=Streptomyces sp. NPDC016469 TaxID=3157191 RepID=UPI0033CEB289
MGMVFSGGAGMPSGAQGAKGSAAGAGADERADRSAPSRKSLLSTAATAAANPLVTLTVDGHDIVLTWPDAVPTPIIDGPRALYPEILPGADLVLTAADGGFAQLLVIKNRQAATDPRVTRLVYGLSSPDLNFALDPVTGIVSAIDTKGADIAEAPTPLMWDSAGTPTLTDGQAGSSASPPPPPPRSSPPSLRPPAPRTRNPPHRRSRPTRWRTPTRRTPPRRFCPRRPTRPPIRP